MTRPWFDGVVLFGVSMIAVVLVTIPGMVIFILLNRIIHIIGWAGLWNPGFGTPQIGALVGLWVVLAIAVVMALRTP